MSLSTTSTRFLNSSRDTDSTTHLGSQSLTILSMKKENFVLPWHKLQAVSLSPTTYHLRKETNTHLTTTFFQVVAESNGVSLNLFSRLSNLFSFSFLPCVLLSSPFTSCIALLCIHSRNSVYSCSEKPKTEHSI